MHRRLRGRICWKTEDGKTYQSEWSFHLKETFTILSVCYHNAGAAWAWVEIERV